jgi:hypothetical protein
LLAERGVVSNTEIEQRVERVRKEEYEELVEEAQRRIFERVSGKKPN